MLVLATIVVAGGACDPLIREEKPPPAELGSFPYHPLVYHLDLSILAYQIHGQSLVWPFDPFYEDRGDGATLERAEFMVSVAQWAQKQGGIQSGAATALDAYRGPGVLGGFPNNPSHDPIIYNYARIHPWSDAIMNAAGRWTEYRTPPEITGSIADVYVAQRVAGGGEADVLVQRLEVPRIDGDPDATDTLLAFEGGTGDKGEPGQPASQSLLGFVLMRDTGSSGYDVHVVFRGSRSGSAARAATEALSTQFASGNPDWITDLGYRTVTAPHISDVGAVARGFARSVESTIPTLFAALTKAAELRGGGAPRHIYVTGHSLGGALAQHFVSAMLLGSTYGPDGRGEAMPTALAGWPWTEMKLITFGAPRTGDEQWAMTLTQGALDSAFYFETPTVPFDADARYVTDPEIVERFHDASRPAGLRVLVSTDAITLDTISGGSHVGQTVYVNGDLLSGWFGLPSFGAHEPERIRGFMTEAMADPRTPATAWSYHSLAAFVEGRNEDNAGSQAEYTKLGEGVRRYYETKGFWFDNDAFESDLDLLFAIEEGAF